MGFKLLRKNFFFGKIVEFYLIGIYLYFTSKRHVTSKKKAVNFFLDTRNNFVDSKLVLKYKLRLYKL